MLCDGISGASIERLDRFRLEPNRDEGIRGVTAEEHWDGILRLI